ncbi:MAG: hypothetical protein K0S75_3051 [Clostridia bacterium]|jgi:hypothetical protein|nr:hypothetical protein [Clostridia bacterium]
MNNSGFNKLFWGFLFIMFNFRIQGFDILPDVVGYLFLASGFSELLSNSNYFSIAAKYNVPMIVLSLFSIYQSPAQGSGIHLGLFGIFGIPIVIASFILNLLVIYHLFMGTKDMAEQQEQPDLAQEADKRWNQYKLLQFAFLFSFILIFIPPLAFLYIIVFFIISIIITIAILGFLRRCSERLNILT